MRSKGIFLILYLLWLGITAGVSEAATAPAEHMSDTKVKAPTGLVHRVGDRSVILHWQAVSRVNLAGYDVYRADLPSRLFEKRTPALLKTNHFVDVEVENNRTYLYRVRALDNDGRQSDPSTSVRVTPSRLDDEAFIDLIQQTAFDYFWYEANAENGLIRDRNTSTSPANIAAVGFGLSVLTVGIDRGWISREAGRKRVHAALRFFWNSQSSPADDATGYQGFYYRFLDMKTGRRAWFSELSSVDTALLMSGILHVRQYFDQTNAEESAIRILADALYLRVQWTWMQVRDAKICHGWKPRLGFMPYDWVGYNEGIILYLLALGSPSYPASEASWAAWTRGYAWRTYYGYSFVIAASLFVHQYPHAWIDFRGIQDAYMRARGIDYFGNSRRATLANRAYAMDNPRQWFDYGENVWGLTASDSPTHYRAHGAPPALNDAGTIAPTAAASSLVFTPEESLAALRHMYAMYRTQLWGTYGLKGAFNPSVQWFNRDYIGIDLGATVLMIENHRTGWIWDVFMRNAAIQRGLARAGFTSIAGGRGPSERASLNPNK